MTISDYLSAALGSYDVVVHGGQYLEQPSESKTGWEGVLEAFGPTRVGQISPRLLSLGLATTMSSFISFAGAGLIDGIRAYNNFKEFNQATRYENIHEARRAMNQKILTGVLKGGTRIGMRVGFIGGSGMLFSLCIPAYLGYTSVFHVSSGFAITGAIYRFKAGPKQMVVGTILGGMFGTGIGSIWKGYCDLKGITCEEFWQELGGELFLRHEEQLVLHEKSRVELDIFNLTDREKLMMDRLR